MAKLALKPTVSMEMLVSLDEEEVRALDALTGYGDDAFIKVFYEKLGSSYMRDHEQGLRRFFQTIRQIVPGYLNDMNKARQVFNHEKVARDK